MENKSLSSQSDTKVDKMLLKNLIIGFISSNNNLNKDQSQILKIISTVLDFTKQDNEKLNVNKNQASWLSSILHPQGSTQGMSQESLSQAFVRFLENESTPRELPNLLEAAPNVVSRRESNASSKGSSSGQLNEVVLPTFTDFAQSRSSSSILKEVLKDNS